MRDDDRLLDLPDPEFGSGVIGVCDICGIRQAVIILQRERFKLCVLDFLNKSWIQSKATPGASLPPYRSERVWFSTTSVPPGQAPALLLVPTRPVRHPIALITPDLYGITTSLLDGAIRLAREGFEVMIPELSKTDGLGAAQHMSLRIGARLRGGVPSSAPPIRTLIDLFHDALQYLRGRDMIDPTKSALIGISYGGSLAAILAAEESGIGALALAYPAPISPPQLPRLVPCPVFLALAGREARGGRVRSQWEDAREAAGVELTTLELPSARGHYLSRDLRDYNLPAAERTWAEMLGFLHSRLLPPPPKPPAPRSAPDPLAPPIPKIQPPSGPKPSAA
jgi:carboxymethylenebutenolidase